MIEYQQQSVRTDRVASPSPRFLEAAASLKYFSPVKPVPRGLLVSSFIAFWLGLLFIVGGMVLLVVFAVNQEDSVRDRDTVLQYDVRVEQICPAGEEAKAGGSAVSGAAVCDRAADEKEARRKIIQSHRSYHSEMAPGSAAFFVGAIFLIVVGALLPLFYYIVLLVVLYRGWKSVQPLRVVAPEMTLDMPTAGGAVGLLFVPLFNYYWVFRAYRDMVRHGRLLSELSGRRYRGPSDEVALAIPIIQLSSLLLSGLAMLACMIVAYFYMLRVNDMLADLGNLPEEEAR